MSISRPRVIVAAAALVCGLAVALPTQAVAAPSTLMISTYLEGTGFNKAIELFNPTDSPVQLSDYQLLMYANANFDRPQATWSGPDAELAPGDHYVLVHAQASEALLAKGDAEDLVTNFNGDDSLQLLKGTDVVDSFGQFGVRPNGSWTSNGVSSLDQTLLRDGCVTDTVPDDAFDPSVQWVSHPVNSFDLLGTFSCDGTTPEPTATPTPEPTQTTSPGDVLKIGEVQGSTDVSPFAGQDVTVEGTVSGNFQTGGFNGYFLQDGGDGDETTSDGIFIYSQNPSNVAVGTALQVTGRVSEFNGQTQITPSSVTVLDGTTTVEPVALTLPLSDYERYESMLVTFPDELTIIEYFDYDRYGSLVVGTSRQDTPTAVVSPGQSAQALLAENRANRIILDDGSTAQNPTPLRHPNGQPFTRDNYFRGGDTLANITGVLVYNFSEWKIEPTAGADHTYVNERPGVPEVGGDLTVASMNVLNYFTTLRSDDPNARGADNVEEFERQQAKIVAALAAMDADVVGMMEIENNGTAVENLVRALNSHLGTEAYAAVNTGVVGSDAIFQAFIYKIDSVSLAGDWAAYDYQDSRNRPTLVQTFEERATGERFNVAVNHLKSKGSACTDDPDTGDGQGNCNLTRVAAVQTMTEWLDEDPTGQGADRTIVMGDLNSYDHEDPIMELVEAGYTDLEKRFGGEHAYSYVFDGMVGYLDYALANEALEPYVTGTASWHINADESDVFDYDISFKKPAEQALWAPDPYRSSDHDPVLIGLTLTDEPEPEPTPTPTPTPTPSVKPGFTPSAPYTLPGLHQVNGRTWFTKCEKYSQTDRCRTDIWASAVVKDAQGRYTVTKGWVFNNMTYLPYMTRAQWAGNPLGYANTWTSTDGRKWATECDTASTGGNGCRSYMWTTVVSAQPKAGGGYTYVQSDKWVFNNIVMFR